jgi:hypothetical protein
MSPHSTLQSKILFDILPSVVRSLCDVSFGFSDQNFICILLPSCCVNLLFQPSFEHSNKNVRVQVMQFSSVSVLTQGFSAAPSLLNVINQTKFNVRRKEFVHFSCDVSWYQAGRRNIPNWMAADIPRIHSTVHFFVNATVFCSCRSKMFELCHILKVFMICICTQGMFHICVTSHVVDGPLINFLCVNSDELTKYSPK